MLFGLRNTSQSFQQRIDAILKGLLFTFAYIDDVLIATKSMEDHIEHLQFVSERLQHHRANVVFW